MPLNSAHPFFPSTLRQRVRVPYRKGTENGICRWALYKRIVLSIALLAGLAGLISGCAYLYPRPEADPLAQQLFDRLDSRNRDLIRFKALADVRMAAGGRTVFGRVAMAAIFPDKFRIEWLNMIGQPITSLAGDGRTITIFSHLDNKTHKLQQSAKAMEPLIHIPIGVENLQKILLGRVPSPADVAIQMNLDNDADGVDCLVLKNRWHTIVETLKVDRQTSRPQEMKVFDQQGELQYEIQWLQWQTVGKYLLPAQLTLESASGQRVGLNMSRFWPDAQVPDSIFNLAT